MFQGEHVKLKLYVVKKNQIQELKSQYKRYVGPETTKGVAGSFFHFRLALGPKQSKSKPGRIARAI